MRPTGPTGLCSHNQQDASNSVRLTPRGHKDLCKIRKSSFLGTLLNAGNPWVPAFAAVEASYSSRAAVCPTLSALLRLLTDLLCCAIECYTDPPQAAAIPNWLQRCPGCRSNYPQRCTDARNAMAIPKCRSDPGDAALLQPLDAADGGQERVHVHGLETSGGHAPACGLPRRLSGQAWSLCTCVGFTFPLGSLDPGVGRHWGVWCAALPQSASWTCMPEWRYYITGPTACRAGLCNRLPCLRAPLLLVAACAQPGTA
jgi:hypothetical protein